MVRRVLLIPGHVGVRHERRRPFPFIACVATDQSSRIVVLVHKLGINHSCFDILLIYYFSLKIYFSGCFVEVREDVVAFKIIRGFLQIGAEKWAIVAKMPQLTS